MNDLLLRACRRQPVERPPVWLMRQAGRYLPEYRAVRSRHDFLTMITTPDLAVEVTLQPVNVLGVDAAILFSDILVIPMAMGQTLTVAEGIGPVLDPPLRYAADVYRLTRLDLGRLDFQLEAIRLARRALEGQVPLIGFAGGPWTLASYMVEGTGTRDWRKIKRMMLAAPSATHQLLGLLADATGRLLVAQAKAGAQVLQIFESWAGALGPDHFEVFVLPYLARATRRARTAGVPVIVFAPGAEWALQGIARETGADVIGLDWRIRPAEARARLAPFNVACQGNLDPAWLYARREEIRARVMTMIDEFGPQGYIANLGHGVLRDTPVSHVREFVAAVKTSIAALPMHTVE